MLKSASGLPRCSLQALPYDHCFICSHEHNKRDETPENRFEKRIFDMA